MSKMYRTSQKNEQKPNFDVFFPLHGSVKWVANLKIKVLCLHTIIQKNIILPGS